jgi:hypothetical protein
MQGSTFDDQPREVYGGDPMQALFYALHTVKQYLSFEERGGTRFYAPGQDVTGAPYDWRRYWFGEGPTATE